MPSNHVIEITDATFQQEVLDADQPVLVDFWADWCQPCRIIGPTIDELAGAYAGSVKVGKIDVDSNQEVASGLDISSIPTILLFQGGRVVKKFVGVTAKETLAEALDAVAA